MSHLGRPNGKVVESTRLRPVAQRLRELLRWPVPITGDALGIGTRDAVARLKAGQILMLENLRFHSEEEKNDPDFAEELASYGEIYVNDAFGTAHRAHASTVGVTKLLPAYAGLLMEARDQGALAAAGSAGAPVRGGHRRRQGVGQAGRPREPAWTRSTRSSSVAAWPTPSSLPRATRSARACSSATSSRMPGASWRRPRKRGVQFLLPTDVVVAKEVTRGAEHKTVPVNKIPNSWSVVDIGPQSTEAFKQALEPARTVFWNGPLGVFEVPTFGDGTRAIARYLAKRADEGATVVVGGGDSVAALEELGLTAKMTHISTGGGASLEFMEGRELPGIAALQDVRLLNRSASTRRRPLDDQHRVHRRAGDPRLTRQPNARGSRRPRFRRSRSGGSAVGCFYRCARGGGAA